ncbi:NTPase KAP [Frigoribacterium sp. NBH87]|uniref:KAP family P-loop NTPase fold protein n=1 Tax=Frigoribacterium sp. NBH87 TaxID=2596916 RepID=UPI001628F02B|nr:P-loop NTPase fold protein [Frigoribacterium sp. NBH87]QNE42598.1 NTPase KAP [Frigoribacterium sp. NBH87]
MSETDQPPEKPPMDAPIRSSADDKLGRAPVAQHFAESIRELDAGEGMVVGVVGPWGHGKSSFINLMREQFEREPKLTVIDFNPWMFSGSNQLVNFFLTEIGAELDVKSRSKFGQAADWLAKYAGILKPVSQVVPIPGAGIAGEAASAIIAGIADTTDANLSAKKVREKITQELAALTEPVVVVVDDIDRLTTPEVREIFKLVRLTASFPNIIYLLAFDRVRVEKALTEDGVPGRAYLEKIVQLSFDVPQAPEMLLRSQVFDELNRVIAPVAAVELDEDRWADAYFEIIDPLLSNMRDVTRYAISSKSTIKNLGDEVDLVDLLAMEAVRVFRPDLMQRLATLRSEVTNTRSSSSRKDVDAQKAIDALLADFPEDTTLIKALFNRLFPVALQYVENNSYGSDWLGVWRTAHRMAHIDYLNLYFDRVAPDALVAFRSTEGAFAVLGDAEALKSYLSEQEPRDLEPILEGLTGYESKFTAEMIVPGSRTLLNFIDKIPLNENGGMFGLSRPDLTVGRVVLRMLRKVEDEAVREALVAEILAGIETYSSRLDFIYSVGHREGSGLKLVSKSFSQQLQDELVEHLAESPPAEPEREWDAWRIYDALRESTGESPLTAESDPVIIRSILRSTRSTARSQSMGSRRVKREDRLAWDLVVGLFPSEDAVREAVNSVRQKLGEDEVFELAEKYLDGWRPEQF